MPRVCQMSWDGGQYRWCKMRKGVRYTVTCDQLKCPRTKEGSVKAANEWWRALSGTIEPAPVLPIVYVVRNELGLFKIGYTENWETRRQALLNNSSSPNASIDLVTSLTYADPQTARVVESAIHKMLAAYRVKGEWFDLPVKMVKKLMESTKGM